MIEHVVSTRDVMAKMKSGEISTDRKKDELRDVDVTLDFTPNALSSLLYKQGDTTVLVCVTKAPSLPRPPTCYGIATTVAIGGPTRAGFG